MFDFFIALFGGLYYASKATYENGKTRKADQEIASQMERLDSFKKKYCLTSNEESAIKNYLLSGEHYEEICNKFASDFQYVFGNNWRDKLSIPPMPPILNPKVYKSDAYSTYVPVNHIYWVYRLLLADRGKVDSFSTVMDGFSIDVPSKDMCVKFCNRIEARLKTRGMPNIKMIMGRTHTGECIQLDILADLTPGFQRS